VIKTILMLGLGATLGYFVGFTDARTHEQNVVERLVGRTGGSHRDNVTTDVDREMTTLER
jgi:hypothetical protein